MLWAKWQGVISPVGELRHPGFSLFLEGNTIKGRTSNCTKKKIRTDKRTAGIAGSWRKSMKSVFVLPVALPFATALPHGAALGTTHAFYLGRGWQHRMGCSSRHSLPLSRAPMGPVTHVSPTTVAACCSFVYSLRKPGSVHKKTKAEWRWEELGVCPNLKSTRSQNDNLILLTF